MKATSLSVSQLQDYGNCAKRWQLRRTLKTPFHRGLALVFGTALHAGLETYNYDLFSRSYGGYERVSKRLDLTKATLQNPEAPPREFSKTMAAMDFPPPEEVDLAHVCEMFDASFAEGLQEALEDGGDPLKDEYEKIQRQKNSRKALKVLSLDAFREHAVRELTGIGYKLLRQYSERQDHGDRALFVEEKGELEISGLPFRYIADLVDVRDGKARLWDYKSRAKSDPHIAAMQLVVYALILKQKYGIVIEEIAQLNFIKSVKTPRIELLPYDMNQFEADTMIFHQEVDAFLRGTEANVFPRHQSPFCRACGVREVCFNPKKELELLDAIKQEREAELLFDISDEDLDSDTAADE